MSKLTIEFNADGSKKTTLNFRGQDYILRMTPFEDGVSHGLDKCLTDQMEKALADDEDVEEILDIVDELECNHDDATDYIEQLNNFE